LKSGKIVEKKLQDIASKQVQFSNLNNSGIISARKMANKVSAEQLVWTKRNTDSNYWHSTANTFQKFNIYLEI